MSFASMLIESFVAVLLMLTIGYCWQLNRRLERLRSSEAEMRKIVAELVTTTEAAERAVSNLRSAIGDCDTTLRDKLERAEQLSTDMSDQLRMGDDILHRIGKIAMAVHGVVKTEERPITLDLDVRPSRAAATASAVEAFVQRVRTRNTGAAA
jgi:chromosome segregation ATPase